MKHVLLIDDEYPARELIKKMIDWDSTGFHISYEAQDGAEGLAIYKRYKPDLIVSDIQMPVMDGLELLVSVREIDKNQPFIIFSCHESFLYAKKVIRFGGLDYLIKDTLTPEILYAAINHVKDHLSVTHKQESNPVPEQTSAINPPSQGSTLLKKLIQKDISESAAVEALQDKMPFQLSSYFLIDIKPEEANTSSMPPSQIESIIEQAIRSSCYGACCYLQATGFIVFITVPEGGAFNEHTRIEIIHAIKSRLEAEIGSVTIGVSSNSSDLTQFEEKLTECIYALNYRIFFGLGKIHFYDSMQNVTRYVQTKQLDARILNIRDCLKKNDQQGIIKEIINLYQQDLSGIIQYNYLTYVNSILWSILSEECITREISTHLVLKMEIGNLNIINRLDSIDKMQEYFTQMFSWLVASGANNEEKSYSRRTRQIINYIKNNYINDISLQTIADEFQVHRVHLSRVFKEETGIGINEFIRQYRIESAKVLLRESQYRINEIVYMVGYKNAQNFYTFFVQSEGITPGDYRSKFG